MVGHVGSLKVREGDERLWKGIEVHDRVCNVVEINIYVMECPANFIKNHGRYFKVMECHERS